MLKIGGCFQGLYANESLCCWSLYKPDPVLNTRKAIQIGQELLKSGHTPFVPHLTHLWHLVEPNEYEVWLAYDLEWLKDCKALIRFPGESSGADKEIIAARSLGIPVYYSVDDFLSDNKGK